MGMSYDELTTFGRLRKNNKLGPYGMFQRLVHEWGEHRVVVEGDDGPRLEPKVIAEKYVFSFLPFPFSQRTWLSRGDGC